MSVLSKTDAAIAKDSPIPNDGTCTFFPSVRTNNKKAGKKMKKQPTPSPENIIRGTVSKSGLINLQTIIIPPARINSFSGMDFLKRRKMIGENMNNNAKVFWFSDSVMRSRIYVDSTYSEKSWMKNKNIIAVKIVSE